MIGSKLHTMPNRKTRFAWRQLETDEAAGLLATIIGLVDQGVLVTDLNHLALACNEQFGEIFRLDIDQVVQCAPQEVRNQILHRIPDVDGFENSLNQLYAAPERTATDLLTLQSPYQVIERMSVPLRLKDESPYGRIWLFRDVTRQQNQTRLNKLTDLISSLNDPEPQAIYRRIVEMISEHYHSNCFLSIRQGEAMSFAAVSSPIEAIRNMTGNQLADSYCQFCIQANEPIIIQDAREDQVYMGITPAKIGMTRYAGVPLLSHQNEIYGTLCIIDERSMEPLYPEDLAFLKLMAMRICAELDRESEVLSLKEDLAHANERLIQNEKLAIAGTLSATIAHDIRNILSAAQIDLELGGDSQQQTIELIQNHLTRFNVLAHRLLSYAKPSNMAFEEVALYQAIERVGHLLSKHFQMSGVELSLRVPEDLDFILADSHRIEHLFVNMLMNSLQASSPGGKVDVSAHDQGSTILLTVSDNGPGLRPEVLERLFEPFATTRSNGFGLGLYSCKQILQDCRGSIRAESSPKGTSFHLTFPKP